MQSAKCKIISSCSVRFHFCSNTFTHKQKIEQCPWIQFFYCFSKGVVDGASGEGFSTGYHWPLLRSIFQTCNRYNVSSTSLDTHVSHKSTCSIFFCNGSHRAVRILFDKNLFTNVHIFIWIGSPSALSHPPQSYWHILTPFTTKSNYHTAAQIVRFQRKRRQ